MTRAAPNAPRGIRPGYWFRPRRFGFGARPATWQGWVVTLVFVVAAALVANLASHRGEVYLVLLVPLVAALLWLIFTRTDGEWRWRWGGE
ncbi:hypothetical protein [Sphingomonas hengshuiensis]|uniref:Uncharacterized protein n=1 Tax=Sphingomonas hengshuiensis TaxID=1609977 RepID=A0A7U4JA21_9SPHN|nr:hypothetical protein [Sphingomonas hengshuiensis]AJP73030.1 hypothetical protein TS85_16350 [Sphingomonas hengshuiensis]